VKIWKTNRPHTFYCHHLNCLLMWICTAYSLSWSSDIMPSLTAANDRIYRLNWIQVHMWLILPLNSYVSLVLLDTYILLLHCFTLWTYTVLLLLVPSDDTSHHTIFHSSKAYCYILLGFSSIS
jgi:hypothetical protein